MIFKKKKAAELQIEFNKQKIEEAKTEIFERLHVYKEDECLKDIQELVQIGKNQAILDCHSVACIEDLQKKQALIHAYDEIQSFIEKALIFQKIEAKDGKKAVPGTITQLRRQSTTAGSAI